MACALVRWGWVGAVAYLLSAAVVQAEALVVVTSSSLPPSSLNKSQIRNVFLGKVNTFPDGRPAVPIDFTESHPLRDEFYLKVTNLSAAQARAQLAKLFFTGRGFPPKEGGSSQEIKKLLNAIPGGIGYIEKAALDETVQLVYSVQ